MRSKLPYRKTTDGFLVYQGKLLAQDRGHYLQFPGGGLDAGEDPIAAQIRESKEETGAILTDVKLITEMQWKWPPAWADTLKRKARYEKFQGEHIYFLTGQVQCFVPPVGDPTDQWSTITTLSWDKAIELAEKYARLADEESKVYHRYQIIIMKT